MSRRVFNLERDIRGANWIIDKVRHREIYAQNLYAALCNNLYSPKDVWAILKNIQWDCSWSHAAVMISEIREDDSYHNWYCSGTGFSGTDFDGFVEESYITPEVETDIAKIGWIVQTKRYFD